MHQPPRTAGPALSSFGWALCASVCTHGLLLGLWLHASLAQDSPASIGQKRGGLAMPLTVRLAARLPAQPERSAAQSLRPLLRTASRTDDRAPRIQAGQARLDTAPSPAPQAATKTSNTMAAQPTAEAQQDSVGAPLQPASPGQAGARLANLFAPITSRPLGHGRWGARAAPIPDEAQAAMQREQAIQGLRQAVQLRTEALRTELQTHPLSGACAIRLTLERQTAGIQCSQAQDQTRAVAMLSGILRIQPDMAPDPSDSCIQIDAQSIRWESCPLTAQP